MKIREIRPFLKNLELLKPYNIAYKTICEVENVFLLITLENGIIGVGSANPHEEVVGETPTQTLENCLTDHCQAIVGKDIRHFRSIIQDIRTTYPNKPGTQAVWDIALHDAFAKYLDVSVVDIYGQCIHTLPTSVTIGIMDVTETLREAQEYNKMGFKIIKIKTGQEIDLDIERILKLHENLKGITLRVDANQGYGIDELMKFIQATEKTNLQLIEQPLPIGKENELNQIEERIKKMLVADESLNSLKNAVNFATETPLFGNYNIKLMKCGGLIGAFEIATIAMASEINLFWGCNDESIVSITAALHAAFACPNTKYLDLDGSFDLKEDIVSGGFDLKDGLLSINKKSGFGFELNSNMIL